MPGYEAPVNLVYSSRNRSAAIRIPMYSDNPKTKRLEFRCPDSSCNPYLAFSAMTMAAIDGIQNKIDPGDPMDKDIYHLTPEEYESIGSAPASLDEALDELEKDHDFLLQGRRVHRRRDPLLDQVQAENEVDASACGRIRTSSACTSTFRRTARVHGQEARPRRFRGRSRLWLNPGTRPPNHSQVGQLPLTRQLTNASISNALTRSSQLQSASMRSQLGNNAA